MQKKDVRIGDIGELKVLEEIGKHAKPHKLLELGFGDDAAVFNACNDGDRFTITTDMLVQGVHFDLNWTDYSELGFKAYHVNASDLAAMGARPFASFLSIGVSPLMELEKLTRFYESFAVTADENGCVIAGGDTVRAKDFTINITLVGHFQPGARTLKRSSAKPGDKIFVTGYPGESGMGFQLLIEDYEAENREEYKKIIQRHLRPTARVTEGEILALLDSTGGVIDISDGLYSELGHLSRESKVQMNVDLEKLPVSDDLKKICHMEKDLNMDIILFGGEDYELLFTSSASLNDLRKEFEIRGSNTEIHEIGRVDKGEGSHFFRDGREIKIRNKTYQHFI